MTAVRARLGLVPIVTIRCDGRVPYLSSKARPCRRQWVPTVGAAVGVVRLSAKAEGWKCTRGHDLCPDCYVVVSRVLGCLRMKLKEAMGRA